MSGWRFEVCSEFTILFSHFNIAGQVGLQFAFEGKKNGMIAFLVACAVVAPIVAISFYCSKPVVFISSINKRCP